MSHGGFGGHLSCAVCALPPVLQAAAILLLLGSRLDDHQTRFMQQHVAWSDGNKVFNTRMVRQQKKQPTDGNTSDPSPSTSQSSGSVPVLKRTTSSSQIQPMGLPPKAPAPEPQGRGRTIKPSFTQPPLPQSQSALQPPLAPAASPQFLPSSLLPLSTQATPLLQYTPASAAADSLQDLTLQSTHSSPAQPQDGSSNTASNTAAETGPTSFSGASWAQDQLNVLAAGDAAETPTGAGEVQ
jgi:hypothetical protein